MTDKQNNTDIDPVETQEWLAALVDVIKQDGSVRAHYLIESLIEKARCMGTYLPFKPTTAYVNTISVQEEPDMLGDPLLEQKISALIRWNAVAMVLQAGRNAPEVGGHIASYASAATLYEVGFNHFFHAQNDTHGGDLLYIQGHASPGIYARSFLEGVLPEERLKGFRQEINGQGLTSYPHPWLMPDYWQFPTVSMGLGPISGIYQARFMKYLQNRSLVNTLKRKCWVFCGDGEMDEPESLGAISLAGREKLDNLIFVINCNLQRLDGPVRGNGKIIQELEGVFRGAGWNVIKVIWGSHWDHLLDKDKQGLLKKRMEEALDGDYQAYKAHGGAYTREHFFGKYPELKDMVAHMSDRDIWRLNRGGHDPRKLFAAYHAAVHHQGQPTVILAKTVKGYGMGTAGEAMNITHQQKKMDLESIKSFRDRFHIPIPDDKIADYPFYKPPEDSPEMVYLKQQREKLGGYLPQRTVTDQPLDIPPLDEFAVLLKSSGERSFSTTMAFVRILNILLRNKKIARYIVPIVSDEARTFGMEGLFRQLGIYSSVGQLYEPVDHDQVMYYREDIKGQLLEEGITEAGGMCSWIAAGTAYSVHQLPMIPLFIFYSMFGFQRIGDLAWLAGDAQARGFLLGATAGRTTLAGEGLQHQDGHSHLFAANIPNCIAYDPTFAYELAVIMQDGLERMYRRQENVYYYLTLMNENYSHPAMPDGCEEGIIKGMYCLQSGDDSTKLKVQLLGSGTILREVIQAAVLLAEHFSVSADVWSVTSFNELRRDGLAVERHNRLHPGQAKQQQSYVTQCLQQRSGPAVAATDYVRSFADQIRQFVPMRYLVLGTDGYGRSDTRAALREFFEVDSKHIAYSALVALADEGQIKTQTLKSAAKKLNINPDKPDPRTA